PATPPPPAPGTARPGPRPGTAAPAPDRGTAAPPPAAPATGPPPPPFSVQNDGAANPGNPGRQYPPAQSGGAGACRGCAGSRHNRPPPPRPAPSPAARGDPAHRPWGKGKASGGYTRGSERRQSPGCWPATKCRAPATSPQPPAAPGQSDSPPGHNPGPGYWAPHHRGGGRSNGSGKRRS